MKITAFALLAITALVQAAPYPPPSGDSNDMLLYKPAGSANVQRRDDSGASKGIPGNGNNGQDNDVPDKNQFLFAMFSQLFAAATDYTDKKIISDNKVAILAGLTAALRMDGGSSPPTPDQYAGDIKDLLMGLTDPKIGMSTEHANDIFIRFVMNGLNG